MGFLVYPGASSFLVYLVNQTSDSMSGRQEKGDAHLVLRNCTFILVYASHICFGGEFCRLMGNNLINLSE